MSAQVLGCTALYNLASTPEGEESLLDCGGYIDIVECAARFADSVHLQARAMGTLATLACNEKGQILLADPAVNAHKLALSNLEAHTDAGVRRWACMLIGFLADGNETNQKVLFNDQTLDAVLECLKDVEGEGSANMNEDVAACTCLALDRLLFYPAAREQFMEGDKTGRLEKTNVKSLMQCMSTHQNRRDVQEWGCGVLNTLSEGSRAQRQALATAGVCAAVELSMTCFPDDHAVHSQARHTLANLSAGYIGQAIQFSRAIINDLGLLRERLSGGGGMKPPKPALTTPGSESPGSALSP